MKDEQKRKQSEKAKKEYMTKVVKNHEEADYNL